MSIMSAEPGTALAIPGIRRYAHPRRGFHVHRASAADKQFTSLDDFRANGPHFFDPEHAA